MQGRNGRMDGIVGTRSKQKGEDVTGTEGHVYVVPVCVHAMHCFLPFSSCVCLRRLASFRSSPSSSLSRFTSVLARVHSRLQIHSATSYLPEPITTEVAECVLLLDQCLLLVLRRWAGLATLLQLDSESSR